MVVVFMIFLIYEASYADSTGSITYVIDNLVKEGY